MFGSSSMIKARMDGIARSLQESLPAFKGAPAMPTKDSRPSRIFRVGARC
jgi:hypothetical protein